MALVSILLGWRPCWPPCPRWCSRSRSRARAAARHCAQPPARRDRGWRCWCPRTTRPPASQPRSPASRPSCEMVIACWWWPTIAATPPRKWRARLTLRWSSGTTASVAARAMRSTSASSTCAPRRRGAGRHRRRLHPAPGQHRRAGGAVRRHRPPCAGLDLMRAAGSSLSERWAEFTWRVKNQVRPSGLARWGGPCPLMGTGMAFPWPLISRPALLAGGHLVEDMMLGVELALLGRAARFAPQALVTSAFPPPGAAARSQRTRWEHGHLATLTSHGRNCCGPACAAATLTRSCSGSTCWCRPCHCW